MNTRNKTKVSTIMSMALVLVISACAFDESPSPTPEQNNGGGSSSNSNTTSVTVYKQIERLGRPAINEGLVITNDFLNAFNSIPPSLDLSEAAAPVLAEAAAVLTAVHDYGIANGLPAPAVSDVVAGFLPDVMRIDTSIAIPVGSWGYNGDFTIIAGTTAGASLTGGRKIEDDVMDLTLTYLVAGSVACGPGVACAISDGVSYAGGTNCANAGQGSNPANPGHKCLSGQVARNGSATFPFLATPN